MAAGLALRKRRQRRQVARQIGERGVERRLHVARGAVDVALEIELHGDVGHPERAGRGDLGHAGDLASRRSSGAATVAAMVTGSAPGRLADTRMVGKVRRRHARDGQEIGRRRCRSRSSPIASSVVPTGRRMNGAEKFIASLGRLPGCNSGTAAGSARSTGAR